MKIEQIIMNVAVHAIVLNKQSEYCHSEFLKQVYNRARNIIKIAHKLNACTNTMVTPNPDEYSPYNHTNEFAHKHTACTMYNIAMVLQIIRKNVDIGG